MRTNIKLYSKLAILLSTIILLLTSCENDYYWTRGTLDYEANLSANPYGKIVYDITIDKSWIEIRGAGRYPDIRDLRFLVGEINIYVDRGFIGWLDLTIEGTNRILPFDELSGHIRDDSREAQDFLAAITDRIARYGYVVILVDGEGTPNSKFGVDFGMDVDAYVRE